MERIAAARAHREAAAANAQPQEIKSSGGAWIATLELRSASVQHASIRDAQDQPLHFGDVFALLQKDRAFGEFYVSVLAASPFESFFFECPPITKGTLSTRKYEHVTVRNGRGFASASPDSFAQYLNQCSAAATAFTNLGGDATLVTPCERGSARHVYGHLAAFTRGASLGQQVDLWQTVGHTLAQVLDARGAARTWLNTEGSGGWPSRAAHAPWLR